MFNEQKSAQIAAWLIQRGRDRSRDMHIIKLMKLMYLAERESMRLHGFPMTGDHFVSMPHGPVLSNTLSHANGDAPSSPDNGWDTWIRDKANHKVGLRREVTPESLDHLSRADLAVLQLVWEKFGAKTYAQLRDYTHDPKNCPEWRDPLGSSKPIEYATVFKALGYEPTLATELAAEIKAQNKITLALSS